MHVHTHTHTRTHEHTRSKSWSTLRKFWRYSMRSCGRPMSPLLKCARTHTHPHTRTHKITMLEMPCVQDISRCQTSDIGCTTTWTVCWYRFWSWNKPLAFHLAVSLVVSLAVSSYFPTFPLPSALATCALCPGRLYVAASSIATLQRWPITQLANSAYSGINIFSLPSAATRCKAVPGVPMIPTRHSQFIFVARQAHLAHLEAFVEHSLYSPGMYISRWDLNDLKPPRQFLFLR